MDVRARKSAWLNLLAEHAAWVTPEIDRMLRKRLLSSDYGPFWDYILGELGGARLDPRVLSKPVSFVLDKMNDLCYEMVEMDRLKRGNS
jgi:hypothetical protein